MAINLDISEAPIREARLGAITGYSGTLKDLVERTGRQNRRNRLTLMDNLYII